jgi:hypothetical protein
MIIKRTSKGAKLLGEAALASDKAAAMLGGAMSTEQIKAMRDAERREDTARKSSING